MSISFLAYLYFYFYFILNSQLDFGSKSHNNPIPSSKSDEQQCTLSAQSHKIMPPSSGALTLTHATTQDETHSQATESRPAGESLVLIPDLNMMPADDDSYTDALCGSMS